MKVEIRRGGDGGQAHHQGAAVENYHNRVADSKHGIRGEDQVRVRLFDELNEEPKWGLGFGFCRERWKWTAKKGVLRM